MKSSKNLTLKRGGEFRQTKLFVVYILTSVKLKLQII